MSQRKLDVGTQLSTLAPTQLMNAHCQMYDDSETTSGSLWQFVTVDELITLPLGSWMHGNRLHNGQEFWLVTDGISLKIQQRLGGTQHLAMLRLRSHAGRVHVSFTVIHLERLNLKMCLGLVHAASTGRKRTNFAEDMHRGS